ncbi:hypothetical protein ACJW31_11G118500 [Castanea mollissima]
MASPHHSLLSLAASATTFSIILLCCFTLIEALNGGFSVDLIHRDSPDSPFYNASETHSQRVAKALRRSINRVNHFKPSSSVSPNLAQTDIISNSGEYLMKYSVGTPPVAILGVADTGSDLIWLQCKPCTECYKQAAPIFDPEMSTTYKSISCTSSQCESLRKTSCSNDGTSCQYSVSYGDKSFSNGDLAVDTFTLGSTTSDRPVSLPETIIGCGHDNNGHFDAKGSGIVGLGGGTVSLVSQLSSSISGKFSYCLVPLTSRDEKSSKLKFGSEAVVSGPGTVSTPLIPNSPDTFYFLTLEAMSVGSKRLELSGSSGSGGLEGNIIIDSGTTVTTLPTEFYSEFESAVAEEIDLERGDDPSQFLSLCYKPTSDSIEIPSITAHFTGADVKLNPDTTFIQINEELLCLAFRANQEITIFGNLAQSNLLVGYDLVKKTVSFKPTDCTKL